MSVAVRAFTAVPAPTQTVAALCTACLVLTAAPSPVRATAPAVPVITKPSISLTAQPLPLPTRSAQSAGGVQRRAVHRLGHHRRGPGSAPDTDTRGFRRGHRQWHTTTHRRRTSPQRVRRHGVCEAGRDLIGFAQDIAVFQLQFRATTLSAFPPFNSGPGQQFVVDTTAFGLNITQQMADFARAVITSVEKFTTTRWARRYRPRSLR